MTSAQLPLSSNPIGIDRQDIELPRDVAECQGISSPQGTQGDALQGAAAPVVKNGSKRGHNRPHQKPAGRSGANKRHSPAEPNAEFIMLRVDEVAWRYRVSRATVWRWSKELAGFPAPVHIAPATTRWYLSDLLAYDAQCRAGLVRGGR